MAIHDAYDGLLDRTDPVSSHVISCANEIMGFPRHLSQHVGGFVITRRPLCETVPIEPAAMAGPTSVTRNHASEKYTW